MKLKCKKEACQPFFVIQNQSGIYPELGNVTSENLKSSPNEDRKESPKVCNTVFEHIIREDYLEKSFKLGKVEGSRKRRSNMRWIVSLKEATGLSLQELNRTVDDRTF